MKHPLRWLGLAMMVFVGVFALGEATTITADDDIIDKAVKTLAGIIALLQVLGAVIVGIINWSEWIDEGDYDEEEADEPYKRRKVK